MDNEHVEHAGDEMHHRQITLADGRYMIFYTFGDHRRDPENAQQGAKSEAPDVIADKEKNDV